MREHASNHVAVSARNGLQQFQLDLKQCLIDEANRLCMRFRLGLETNALEFCPHVSAAGVACEHKYDRFGYPGLRDIYLDGVILLKNPRLSRLREQSWQGC